MVWANKNQYSAKYRRLVPPSFGMFLAIFYIKNGSEYAKRFCVHIYSVMLFDSDQHREWPGRGIGWAG